MNSCQPSGDRLETIFDAVEQAEDGAVRYNPRSSDAYLRTPLHHSKNLTMRTSLLRRVSGIALLFTTLFLTSCSEDAPTAPDANTLLARRFDALVDSIRNTEHIPGIVVGVWDEAAGFSYTHGSGVASIAATTPILPDMQFRIGSLTKTYTGTVVLQLVDEGRIGLDDRVSKHLDSIPHGDVVTIRQLLGMTSGIESYTMNMDFWARLEADPGYVWSPRELIGLVQARPLRFTPGTEYNYSNTNTIILGLVVEKLTGRSLAQELSSRIFTPLGLTKTYVASGRSITGHFFAGHWDTTGTGQQVIPALEYDVSSAWSAGAIVSTVDDVRRFVETMVGGTLISPALRTQRFSFRNDGGYGLACEQMRGYIGHSGAIAGYFSLMAHHPTLRRTIVIGYNLQGMVEPEVIFNLIADVLEQR